jgi:3-hydroxyisobutyrate dehydrogenase-like beta-hydroxyacid dehydrogenase
VTKEKIGFIGVGLMGHGMARNIRRLNQDVIHLHKLAIHGASVIVLPSMKPKGLAQIY